MSILPVPAERSFESAPVAMLQSLSSVVLTQSPSARLVTFAFSAPAPARRSQREQPPLAARPFTNSTCRRSRTGFWQPILFLRPPSCSRERSSTPPQGRDPLPHHLEDLIHPGQSSEEFQSGLARTCRQLWDRATIVVLHGHVTQAAAIDLESKLTEAALGQVQLADYRNFAHGRHHWFAKHGESSAIITC